MQLFAGFRLVYFYTHMVCHCHVIVLWQCSVALLAVIMQYFQAIAFRLAIFQYYLSFFYSPINFTRFYLSCRCKKILCKKINQSVTIAPSDIHFKWNSNQYVCSIHNFLWNLILSNFTFFSLSRYEISKGNKKPLIIFSIVPPV